MGARQEPPHGAPWSMRITTRNMDLRTFYENFRLKPACTNPVNTGTSVKQPLSGPPLTTVTINIEGFTQEKATILAEICGESKCDVLCIQETYIPAGRKLPWIDGMKVVATIPHNKHGSDFYTRKNLEVNSAETGGDDSVEIITIDLDHCTVTSVNNPPGNTFTFCQLTT